MQVITLFKASLSFVGRQQINFGFEGFQFFDKLRYARKLCAAIRQTRVAQAGLFSTFQPLVNAFNQGESRWRLLEDSFAGDAALTVVQVFNALHSHDISEKMTNKDTSSFVFDLNLFSQ